MLKGALRLTEKKGTADPLPEQGLSLNMLQKRILDLESEVQCLKQRLHALTEEHATTKTENEKMRKELDKTKVEHATVSNIRQLMRNMPQNSPVRRPLLKELTKSLSWTQTGPALAISKSTFLRARREPGTNVIFIKYHPRNTKDRISPETRNQASVFLDLTMPFVSGGNYRLQRGTFTYIYQNYISYSHTMGWIPVGRSYLHRVVHEDNVRKVNKVDICPTCKGLSKSKSSKQAIEEHQRIARIQTKVAMGQVQTLPASDVLCVQDFTQIELSPSGFLQDLIIVVYRRPIAGGDLNRTYHHYVGKKSQSNDFHFVKGCWEDLLSKMNLKNNSTLHIWSDGGRKHFKQSGHVRFWGETQESLRPKNITIQYHFYASHHGHNACDAVAAHAKARIKRYQLNSDNPVQNQADVIKQLGQMKCSVVEPAKCGLGKPPKVPTLKGISRYHFFKFPEKGRIFARITSEMLEEPHNFYYEKKQK